MKWGCLVGYGSVIKLLGNRRKPFQVRVCTGRKENGRLKYSYLGYYATREEGLAKLAEYNNKPWDIDKKNISFEELYSKWSSEHFSRIGKTGVSGYKTAYKYCQPLYKQKFCEISYLSLQATVDNSNKNYYPKKEIKKLLNQLYNYAIKLEIVDKRLSEFIECGSNDKESTRKPFTQNEIQILWDNINKIEFVDTILLLIYTGLRISELLSIKIENVHLSEKYMIGRTERRKHGRNRKVPLHNRIIPIISKYYNKNKDKEYLITNKKGEQMKYDNYYKMKFKPIIDKLGLDKHKPHDRETHNHQFIKFSRSESNLCKVNCWT